MAAQFDDLMARVSGKTAKVGVIGLGYVGLPLAISIAEVGFRTIGFDTDETKIPKLDAAMSYIDAVSDARLKKQVDESRFSATSDMSSIGECDIVIICVPTPIKQDRSPDLSYVSSTTEVIAAHLRPGQVVVLESTTWPGTTVNVVRPILEKTGLKSGQDIFIGFSPEREDPGNAHFGTSTIPKIVSGDGPDALQIIETFYGMFIEQVVPVSNTDTAEAVKITENVFRAVNIALVNELKVIYEAMGIDVWEVVDAAKTKPFGYMPFYPGPGLGGHCIPIDPFYLSWRAREFGISTRFIELAGEINRSMPMHVFDRLERAVDLHLGKGLSRSRVLVCGVAYKPNVADIRESPALEIMSLLNDRKVTFDYFDTRVPRIPPTREWMFLEGRTSVELSEATVSGYDAVIIVTDHDDVDYDLIAGHAPLIIDTRNALGKRGIETTSVVVKA